MLEVSGLTVEYAATGNAGGGNPVRAVDDVSLEVASGEFVGIVGSTGSSGLNQGRLFVELKPRDQRPALEKVLADLRRDTARIPGISAYPNPVQNLRIGGRSSRATYQFVMQSQDRPTNVQNWMRVSP